MNKRFIMVLLAGWVVLGESIPAEAFLFWGGKPPKEETVLSKTDAVSDPALLTLKEAYRLALKQSESVAAKSEELNVAQGHFYQALNVVMPKVNFVMTRSEQDVPTEGTLSGNSVGGTFLKPVTNTRRFTFSQPLFSGFKEFAAIQGAGAEKRQKRNEIKRAKELLFVDVMEAFYNFLQARREVEILESTRQALRDRVEELGERVKLGRSRENEMQTSTAELKVTEAQLLEATRFQAVSRQLLEFYIGYKIDGALTDELIPAEVLAPEEDYLLKADARSDVRAAADSYFLKQKGVTVAQAGLFPEVTLNGNYYTRREGFQSGVTWDTLVTVDVPIFNGTETVGDIKVAVSEKDKEKYLYLQTKRMARLDIQNAYEEYVSSRAESGAYREASEALQKDYDLQVQDYRTSLVNNLDVLDSLRRYQDTRRTYNATDYNARRNYWKLQAAAGEISIVNEEEKAKK